MRIKIAFPSGDFFPFLLFCVILRVSQGFWETREHEPIFREQENKTLQIRGRKHGKQIRYKGNKYGKRAGTWEHRAILEGNKGTRNPPGDPLSCVYNTAASGLQCNLRNKVIKINKIMISG